MTISDRKQSLRDFQARLSERLREAASDVTQSARLGVQVGDRRLLVELSEAGEVVPVPAMIAPVPLTRDWFRGLVNLRGALYAVSDLAGFAGDEPTPTGREARLIAFAPRLGLNAALIVGRMLGLQNLETMRPTEAEAETAAALRPAWLGARWLDAEGQVWRELSLAALATDDRFLAVAR
jgi:twitching motility protein PilI